MQNKCFKGIRRILLVLTLVFCLTSSIEYPIYTSSCDTESSTRLCTQRNNLTQYILSLKKGGTNILSASDYDKNFFLCEQYTFDCGYVEDENQTVSIANGIQLKLSEAELNTVLPSNVTLVDKIKRYLNMPSADTQTVFKNFPLTLTAAQSDLFFTNFMNNLLTQIKNKYATEKLSTSKTWTDINVNIRTAISEVIKEDQTLLSGSFWDDFRWNNFTQMASYLKDKFRETDKLYYLRSSYLIDSVSKRCNKYQSVNFLVDESGSIGSGPFRLALDFLVEYFTRTFDDPALTSLHFYDDQFDPYMDYGKTRAQLITAANTKFYRSGGTLTGKSINATIAKILAANFEKGLNKVMVVMTDGFSFDDVKYASDDARSKGITMIAVGIGSGANDAQLLQIAQTPSNIIKVASYADLDKLVNFIENFFCKQIIDIKVNETITGNVVRVPESPSYFRLERNPTIQVYELKIKFDQEPELCNATVQISQFDPFPDEFSYYRFGKRYKTSPYEQSYFIYPAQQSELRVKKKLFTVQNFEYAYMSMSGVNIRFNLSLSKCSTADCSAEKVRYESIEGSVVAPTPNTTSDDLDISNSVYTTSCPFESAARVCPQKGNLTEYLMSLKKGSSDLLSLADYDKNFFVCEEYAFDCGYVENQNETISIANGIELRMNASQVDTILPSNSSLGNNIKTYLGLNAQDAKCGMKIYPLVLTAAESDLFFTNYMNLLVTEIKTKYEAQKSISSLPWTDLNINIKTAVSEVIKQDSSMMSNDFWTSFRINDWSTMSNLLKIEYQTRNQKLHCLRSSYLIDAVTQKCNKYQSINFLIDESGSIGLGNFNLAIKFLEQFITVTNDDPELMSVNFYDAAFDPLINYNSSKSQIITAIKAKTYRAGGTYTGRALKSAVDKILTSSLGDGVNKILIVITDGQSYDQVLSSAKYANDNKITVIAVGVGPGVNDTQMLEIAQSPTNVIKASSFMELTKLAKYIGNFLCKQVIDLKFNTTSTGHSVKVPLSPTYFKVEKSWTQTNQLQIIFDKNPDNSSFSLYVSDYDPFPNEYSEYSITQAHRKNDIERYYYITSIRMSETRKKKSYFKLYNFTNTYIAVAGNDIKFSIALKPCSSNGCATPKPAAFARTFEVGKVNELREEDTYNLNAKQENLNVEGSIQSRQDQQNHQVVSSQTAVIISGIMTFLMVAMLLFLVAYKHYLSAKKEKTNSQQPQTTTKFDPEITEQQIEEAQFNEYEVKEINEIETTN